MAKFPLTPTNKSSGQGSNFHSPSPTHDSVVGYSSPPRIKHEISYQHLRPICPITHQFAKAVKLILGIQHLPYASRKPKITLTWVVVSSVEEVVLSTLEGLLEVVEDKEEPSVF